MALNFHLIKHAGRVGAGVLLFHCANLLAATGIGIVLWPFLTLYAFWLIANNPPDPKEVLENKLYREEQERLQEEKEQKKEDRERLKYLRHCQEIQAFVETCEDRNYEYDAETDTTTWHDDMKVLPEWVQKKRLLEAPKVYPPYPY